MCREVCLHGHISLNILQILMVLVQQQKNLRIVVFQWYILLSFFRDNIFNFKILNTYITMERFSTAPFH